MKSIRFAPGGRVGRTSTKYRQRFNIRASSLPVECKQRLLALRDSRVNRHGVIVIKACRFRSQDKNRTDALMRLQALVRSAMLRRKPRRPTRPSNRAKAERMNSKTKRGRVKVLRSRVAGDE